MTDDQLKEAGRKALEAKQKQEAYDKLYLARQRWVMRQLIATFNKNGNYDELVAKGKAMTLKELTA